jgi:hypothetical protein
LPILENTPNPFIIKAEYSLQGGIYKLCFIWLSAPF